VRWYLEGISYDPARIDLTVNVRYNPFTYNMDPTVTYRTATGALDNAQFDNLTDYHARGEAELEAEKDLQGRDWLSTEAFTFEIIGVDGAPVRRLSGEGASDRYELLDALPADAVSGEAAVFEALQFLETDIPEGAEYVDFTYIVHERVPAGATVTLDDGTTLVYSEATDEQKAAYEGQWTYHSITYAADQRITLRVTDVGDETMTVEPVPGE